MKKTEKIEVRLSIEEKADLARVSEADGRPISEIVRGYINEHLAGRLEASETDAKKEKRMSVVQKLAWLGVGGVIGAGALYTGTLLIKEDQGFDIDIHVIDQTDQQRRIFRAVSTIPANYAEPTTISLPINETNAYRVTASMTPLSGKTATMALSICHDDGTSCEEIAKPSLIVHPENHSRLDFGVDQNRQMQIEVYPM